MINVTQYEKINTLLDEQKGILQTSDVLAAGISKTVFLEYVQKNKLQRAAHGVYVKDDVWADPMYLLQVQYKQGIFSHDTALYLHGMTDREPLRYSVTVKSGYNSENLKAAGAKTYYIKKELYDVGITTLETPFGYMVRAYDKERTICDIMRNRNTIDIQLIQDALRQYTASRDKNLHTLSQYSKLFHVEKVLKPYLEVLL